MRKLVFLIICLMTLTFGANLGVTFAATFTVNTNLDNESDGCAVGLCTLREAVTAANTNAAADTITFDPAFFNQARTITLGGTDIIFTADGAATNTLVITNTTGFAITVSGNNASRVFTNNTGAVTEIRNLIVTGGNGVSSVTTARGGGIYNNGGTLTLTNVVVTGNTTANGGGMNNAGSGTVNLVNCTLSANVATASGGGMQNFSGSFLNITGTTVSGNTSNSTITGGGGLNLNGTVTITNSTISGNTAQGGDGGGINYNGQGLTMTSTTIANNTATDQTGGLNKSTTTNNASLRNNLIANNTGGTSPEVAGLINSLGYNLIQTVGTSTGWVATDILNQPAQIAPLASNGGPTQTHALLSNSPAIDKGNSFGLTTDQRGLPRPVDIPSIPNATGGDGSDIGAFEAQSVTAAGVTVSGRVMTSTGKGLSRAVVLVTDMQGQTRRTLTDRTGRYTFEELEAGATYIFEAKSKIYSFAPQVVTVSEDLDELNFIAQ